MGYTLNTTSDYHSSDLKTLGWELTVCNALQPQNSPCRGALLQNGSFGVHLFNFLEKLIPLKNLNNVLEIGGGMGYLMKDFLTLAPRLQATMLDISPFLIQKQKEALADFPANFRETDFLKMPMADLYPFDLVILNENLGDFPTLVFDSNHPGQNDPETNRFLNIVSDYEEEYSLAFTPAFNINIGALKALEKLCGAGIPYIYLSEHSCEAYHRDPSFPRLNFEPSGSPEKIALHKHDEFTVKFSHLETIARAFRYQVFRGRYIDILPINFNNQVTSALQAPTPLSDEQEILQHFIYDLYKYEYLVLINDSKKRG